MIKVIAFIFMGLVCIAADQKKNTSASVPHDKLVAKTTPWSYCYTAIQIGGKQVVCSSCGGTPSFIRIHNGKVQAYCLEHLK